MGNEEHQKIKDGIKSTFDNVAKSYDENIQFIISAQKMVELIELDSDELHILDLSTGTGNIAVELGKKFPNAKIFGIDISDEMLNIARSKTKEQGIDNITYHVQDVENLAFGDMKFDLITCGYGIFFYPNMDRFFCDVCAMLKEDGKFIFSTFSEDAFQPYSKIFLEMLEENYGIKPPQRLENRKLSTEDEIQEFSSQVTHKKLEVREVEIKFPMQIQEWWKLLNSTGYQGLLSQLESNYEKFEKEYIEHLKSLSKDDSIEFNANSFISVLHV
ncbi:MAG: methyltransferase domain-containing protein [Sulfuricurvum sp.]|nr:methyltransferase domain-containing protein [Sulfuricurvum sp.]